MFSLCKLAHVVCTQACRLANLVQYIAGFWILPSEMNSKTGSFSSLHSKKRGGSSASGGAH